MPFLPPASIAILHRVMRSSMESFITASPLHSIARYVAPSTPISPITFKMTSFAIIWSGNVPVNSKHMDSGTLTQSFPVPRINAASVLPIPVENIPKAPDVEVWESVPNKTSPGRLNPS